nr:hypothetical protein [Microbacterium bovistercoris]
MTMHPSIGYTIITQEIEERARNAERRRFILDHPEQIHRRPAGWWRRMLRRIVSGRAAAPSRPAPCETASAR